jgi:acetylornithine deacetylase/succinyl-diaminopimelate desuccinylase-like protein
MRKFILIFLISPFFGVSQSAELLKIRDYRTKNEHEIMGSFNTLLSIPNIAADITNIKLNAEWIVAYMQSKNISNVQLLTPNTPNKPPVVYGEVVVPGAKETIIFYAHYDGQPVDSTKWLKGLHPFRPQLVSNSFENKGLIIPWPNANTSFDPMWRIYSRGASDDKAGVMAIINGYAALASANITPSVNIKFFFEGEEEAGSTHLQEILEKYKSILTADMWVICDGPVHQSGKKQVVFGVRGDTHVELTVFGPKRPLHSGHYGNWVPNPGLELAKLLASMKNEKGDVTIKGFYDDVIPLTASEKKALALVPSVDDQLKSELGFKNSERPSKLNDALNLPSLNINGIQSAGIGKQSANVIPTKAIASIDLRLVLGNDWKRQQEKVVSHVVSQGFFVVDKEPTDEERMAYDKICMITKSDGYNAQKTSMDNPFAKRISTAVQLVSGQAPILMPTLGGSLPLYVFEKVLNTQPITVPIANHDNNQHAENENIRIKNFWEGIEIFASIMMLPK